MRLATFNVENLFDRPRAMNLETWAEGKPHLEDYTRLNMLIQKEKYTQSVKDDLVEIMGRHKGLLTTGKSKFIRLRGTRGKFIRRSGKNRYEIAADSRADWIGWFELETEPVKETATENTARIIGLVNADVLGVVEAEDRPGLRRFNEDILPRVEASKYDHIMLIDGNDERGIDVGVMAKSDFEIKRICSHVDDRDDQGYIFSRDCAEYEIATPKNNRLLVLLNHFKSKGFGNYQKSAEKRLRQATRVRAIYEQRVAEGHDYVAILGDFNEPPGESPMDPLIRSDSNLTDVMVHPKFVGDGRTGTHGNGAGSAKFDYILMSPKLCVRATAAGVERRGVWGGKNGTLFPHLETIEVEKDAASDHAVLWVDVDV